MDRRAPSSTHAHPNGGTGSRLLAVSLVVLWLAIAGVAAMSLALALVPFVSDSAIGLLTGNYSRVETDVAQVEFGVRFKLPVDPAVSALDAGRALYTISEAGVADSDSSIGRAVPRAIPQWIPNTDNPFKEGWSVAINTLIPRAAKGLSLDEARFLQTISSNPGFEEFAAVARAADLDWIGARLGFQWPPGVSAITIPFPRLAAVRLAAEANVGRAAWYLSQRRLTDAEATLREVVSFGLVLRDNTTTLLNTLVGVAIARIGLDNLEKFYNATGHNADANALHDQRLSAERTKEEVESLRKFEPEGSGDRLLFRRTLIGILRNSARLRSLRWDVLWGATIIPCTNTHELLFGPDDDLRTAIVFAHDDLVRSEGDAALFQMLTTAPLGPIDGLDVGPGVKAVHRIGQLAQLLLGGQRIADCVVLPVR